MAGLKEFYCRSNETSLGSQFKWLEYTFKIMPRNLNVILRLCIRLLILSGGPRAGIGQIPVSHLPGTEKSRKVTLVGHSHLGNH